MHSLILTTALTAAIIAPLAHARAAAEPTPATFRSFVGNIEVPEMLFDNENALESRLQFLEQAPKGAEVKILTFVFDLGESTRRLAAHVCRAAQRGVKVKLMADSKSGAGGTLSPFRSRINSEIYQYMANCGAEVRIFNKISREQLSMRKERVTENLSEDKKLIVKYRKDQKLDVKNFDEIPGDLTKYLRSRLSQMALKLGAKVIAGGEAELLSVFAQATSLPKDLAMNRGEILNVLSALIVDITENVLLQPKYLSTLKPETVEGLKQTVRNLTGAVQLWRRGGEINKADAVAALFNGLASFNRILKQELPPLGQLSVVTDLPNSPFNRLNHRKLFHIKSADTACLLLGGRNLGDHYMANHQDSWWDTDVRLCTNHNDASESVARAEVSFNELWNAQEGLVESIKPFNPSWVTGLLSDWGANDFDNLWVDQGAPKPAIANSYVLGAKNPKTKADTLTGNRKKEFLALVREIEASHRDLEKHHELHDRKAGLTGEAKEIFELAEAYVKGHVTLGRPLPQQPIREQNTLQNAEGWRLLITKWRVDEERDNKPRWAYDEIRQVFRQAIADEQKEIYIETPYAQFLDEEKKLLENALDRGVKVTIKSNGLYTADGVSWLIRLHMARWVRDMYKKAKSGQFEYYSTTPHFNHAIHFKGAGFREQKDGRKLFIVTSHNFHPRSGMQDKEHAVVWRERLDSQNDLIDQRNAYFEGLTQKFSALRAKYRLEVEPMQRYESLFREINDASHNLAEKNMHAKGPLGSFRLYLGTALEKNGSELCDEEASQFLCVDKRLEESLDSLRSLTSLVEWLF